jgi:hypothetical protein
MLRRFFILGVVLFSLCLFKLCAAGDLSFRVDKSKVRMVIPAGSSQAGTLKVYSQSSDRIKLKIHFEDWSYAYQQDGSKDFYPPGTNSFSCSEWISFNPPEFTLPPYGTQTVNFVAKVPEEAKGVYFAVMFFETTFLPSLEGTPIGPDELRVGTTLNIKLGTLFYLEVQDTVKRQVEFKNLSLTQDAAAKFFAVNLDLKNTGNADITSKGNFDLIDEKGIVYARGEFNDSYTFPGQEAKLTGIWKKLIDSGKYDLIVTLDLGKSLEEAGLGRGPVIVKEAQIDIGPGGAVTSVGELR